MQGSWSSTNEHVGAVILAAGFGTRLAPLTNTTSKPLLEVGDSPVVSHLLHRLRQIEGLSQVVVVVNGRHSGQWDQWVRDLPELPIVTVVSNGVLDETDRQGAVADMARGVAELQTRSNSDWIVVLAGDNLLDEPLQPHVDAAISNQHSLVLCRDLGDDVPAGRFGEITIDRDQRITRFREKPASPESPYAATCSYVWPGTIADQLAAYLEVGNPDAPGEFVSWLVDQNHPLSARILTGRYFDIGNHETLAAARAAYECALDEQ